MDSVQRIVCKGLTAHEQALLVQQLKMLKGRTAYAWACVGDDGEGQLLIQRERGDRATVTLGAGLRRSIEWPLRMFGLMELLLEHEERVAKVAPPARLQPCEELALLDVRQAHGVSDTLLIVPRDDLVLSRHDNPALVLRELSGALGKLQAQPLSQLGAQPVLAHRHSFKSLLWSLALAQGAPSTGNWQQSSATFHLQAWPLLSEWQSSPAMLRLAALYTRQFASVERGVAFSGASADQVRAFLFACKCCAVGLESRIEVAQPVPAAPAEKSLLQRLRMRLGLGYGKTNKP